MKTVALIIGHSKKDGGAINKNSGVSEFEFNEPLAHSVAEKLLLEGIRPVVIYRDCSYSQLPIKVNRTGADIAVSLHCNAFNQKSNGSEVLYFSKSESGLKLAEFIQAEVVRVLGLKDRGVKPIQAAHEGKAGDRGGLLVQKTAMTCVIVEPFFIDSDLSLELATHNFEHLSEAYVTGIKKYLG